MSKVLIIYGANFAANKVETIELVDPIPCTGILISPTTKSFTTLGETQQIIPTVTPAYTTDTIHYTSSNTDIATVSDSGLITSVGVGSATITVTCGEQSATCTITSTVEIDLDAIGYAVNGKYYGESMNLSADPPKNYINISSGVRGRIYYSTTEYGDYRIFYGTANDGKYAIPLPKGATSVTITAPEGLRQRTFFILANMNEKQTYATGADGNCALGIASYLSVSGTSYPTTIDFSEYADIANGFICSVYAPSSGDASQVSGHTTMVFA